MLLQLLAHRRVPEIWTQTSAEQMAFVRAFENLAALDVLPLDAPDGVPEIDRDAPLGYVGVSQGANTAPALLAYLPEIRAAVLVAGGARIMEVLAHQQGEPFIERLHAAFPSFNPIDVWVVFSLLQSAYDNQDAHNHARFVYRAPIEVEGSRRKASVLLLEGVGDRLIPNNTTDSLAWQLGAMPLIRPVRREVPFLPVVSAPVTGNVDARTTAAYHQLVPFGAQGLDPAPGCVPPALPESIASEGHYCVQFAEESLRQRVLFLRSALAGGAPTIVDPLAPGRTAAPEG